MWEKGGKKNLYFQNIQLDYVCLPHNLGIKKNFSGLYLNDQFSSKQGNAVYI